MSASRKPAAAEARRQLESRIRFYQEATHELRTPLQGIGRVIDSLLAGRCGRLARAQRQRLELVSRAAASVTELAEDLLELEHLDLGRDLLEVNRFDARPLVDGILPLAQGLLVGKPVRLEVDFAGRIPAIHGDARRVQQVLMNLLANAARFTNEGRILLSVRRAGEHVRFEVADTGIGIPPEETQAILAQFHRAGGFVSPGYEGSGLGLSICKRIVDSHRGEMGVNSEQGRGSVFWFTIPTAQSGLLRVTRRRRAKAAGRPGRAGEEQALRAPSLLDLYRGPDGVHTPDAPAARALVAPLLEAARGEGECILVVDDTPINLAILRDLLEDASYRVLTASDVPSALETLGRGSVDLVITDLWMPGKSGFDLVQAMRADVRFAPIPAMILSARRHKSDIIHGLNIGADDYILKPFLPEEFLARVKGHMRLRAANEQLRAFARALEEKVERRTRELSEVREHLLLSERMSSLGQLTAGIAHEINNPIGYALSNIDMLAADLPRLLRGALLAEARAALEALPARRSPLPLVKRTLAALTRDDALARDVAEFRRLARGRRGARLAAEFRTFLDYMQSLEQDSAARLDEADELLAACRDGLARVRDIVLELSAFARPKKGGAGGGVDLSVCVERTLAIAGNALRGKRVHVRKRLGLKRLVRGDQAKLEQVLLNLVLNAVQALPKDGELRIATREAGDLAVLEVSDNGPGIPAHLQDQVFNPFFTTKPVGQGTGLGLSICYRIIADHGGQISFQSLEGRGTTFRITLPLARRAPSGGKA